MRRRDRLRAQVKFQFTRPRGARPAKASRRLLIVVSIHAPARGATAEGENQATEREFQFTRPRGARQKLTNDSLMVIMFQFTRPRGARLLGMSATHGRSEFQFTRPRGARQLQDVVRYFVMPVSIHAPARGATAACAPRPACARFNSRAREGRDVGMTTPNGDDKFQFTRPRGARRSVDVQASPIGVSIHAPARGATQNPRI